MRSSNQRRAFRLLAFAACTILTTAALATERRPLRQARSDNGRYMLEIDPGAGAAATSAPATRNAAPCRAALVRRERAARPETIWESELVNPVAPLRALVHDDGRYVVTLDDHDRGGAAHTLVVYDERGERRAEFTLRDLFRRADWQHAKVRDDRIEWSPGAKFRFVSEPDRLRIELRSGRVVHVHLETGELESPDANEEGDVPAEFAALLDGTPEADEPSAAAAAPVALEPTFLDGVGQMLNNLNQLLAPNLPDPRSPTELRRELLVAQLRDLEARSAFTSDGEEGLRLMAEAGAVRASLERLAALEAEDLQHAGEGAGNSGAVGVPVPQPNPREPVDYVAWMNETAAWDESAAVPLLQAAADGHTPYEGEEELLTRAFDGDPAALASPEISTWIDGNRNAIDSLMAAGFHDYGGMPMKSEAGDLVGVLLPNLSPWRQVAKAAVLDGQRLVQQGDFEAGIDRFVGTLAAGGRIGHGPTLIENLVGVATSSLATQQLLDAYAADADGRIAYHDVANRLETDVVGPRAVAETFQFERAFMMDVIQSGYEFDETTGEHVVTAESAERVARTLGLGSEQPPDTISTGAMLRRAGFDETYRQANEFYDEMTRAARLPYADGKPLFNEIERRISDPAFKNQNPLLAALVPSLSRSVNLTTRAQTNQRAAQVVTRLRAYRQANGSYPDDLANLGFDATDPFSGQPLRYRREGDDFVLYSTGPNGTDDGGRHDPKWDEGDYQFWPRPPKQ